MRVQDGDQVSEWVVRKWPLQVWKIEFCQRMLFSGFFKRF
jgi:hypothetical protein